MVPRCHFTDTNELGTKLHIPTRNALYATFLHQSVPKSEFMLQNFTKVSRKSITPSKITFPIQRKGFWNQPQNLFQQSLWDFKVTKRQSDCKNQQ